mmetsp:Transcript_19438/g.29215  ORF Transcript_19438/g.29215 Transcript_19438/m.29215 type:complete len:552 (-) Transcript_19438:363-2018(-)
MSRSLQSSYPKIFTYEPASLVADQSCIDLDLSYIQKRVEHATVSKMKDAEIFYRKGGFSGAYAKVEIIGPDGAAAFIPKGTPVIASKNAEEEIGKEFGINVPDTLHGKTMEDVQTGDTEIRIAYDSPHNLQNQYLKCDAGAFQLESQHDVTLGCFDAKGQMEFENMGVYNYSYNVLEDNKNYRTLQKFSSEAESEMLMCGERCPHRTFEKYFNYYEIPDYGDRFITSAFQQTHARYVRGNADFSSYSVNAVKEAVINGILYLNVWMHVVNQMEKAIDFCFLGDKPNSVRHWDQSVAVFAGSMLKGKETGFLLFDAASTICIDFMTCNAETTSEFTVLSKLFNKFDQGQSEMLKDRGSCDSAQLIKDSIEDLMAVPLIQGLLRAAYVRSREQDSSTEQARGATLAAAVLPLVHHCNPSDAEEIYSEMKIGSAKPDFVAVKQALERNYKCMKISCSDVGGYYNFDAEEYYKNAAPCTFAAANPSPSIQGGNNTGKTVAVVLILIGAIGVISAYFLFARRKKSMSEIELHRDQNIREAIKEAPPSSYFKSKTII